MKANQRLSRIAKECALSAVHYSTTRRASYDDEDGSWAIIHDFPLPKGYNYDSTDVLVLLPEDYPLTPPDWFYVDNNLRLADGRGPEHLFYEDAIHIDPNEPLEGQQHPQLIGWTACCLHIVEWKPAGDPLKGHSLLSVCELIKRAFERWR